MDNDGDKDKFRDNDNGRDNNNASQFTDKCNVITNANNMGKNDAYSTIHQYSALPASWQNEPIGLAELTGVTEYKIEGDRGEGSGGPSHPPP